MRRVEAIKHEDSNFTSRSSESVLGVQHGEWLFDGGLLALVGELGLTNFDAESLSDGESKLVRDLVEAFNLLLLNLTNVAL